MNLPFDPANLLAAFASAFVQNNRMLKVHYTPNSGLSEDTLLPWKLSGTETINNGFRYELSVVSSDAFIPTQQLIGQPIQVSILTASGDERSIAGWVTDAQNTGSNGGMATYLVVIEDLFAVLSHRINNRVFQDITAKDAFLTIVREHLANNPVLAASLTIDDRCQREYPLQSWITQYNESDAAFGKRRLFEEGINFFFESAAQPEQTAQVQPTVTLVLFDNNNQLEDLGSVRFHRADGTEESDSITAWATQQKLAPGSIAAASYDYKPVAVSGQQAQSRLDQGGTGNDLASTLEDYRHDTPHYGNNPDDYANYARLRMQAHEYGAQQSSGTGTHRNAAAGRSFTLTDHPEIDRHDAQDRQFILTQVQIDATNNLPGELNSLAPNPAQPTAAQSTPATPYTNRFTATRAVVPIVPAYRATEHAQPAAPQLLSATVVGPEGEEIHTDDLGRIRANLHFPRPGDHPSSGAARNENDSVWLRVLQPWTGTQYGALFIPRVGDEVIVGFIGGDIDRPVVIAPAWNGNRRPVSFSHSGDLPGNKALSGFKSKMYKGAGANELIFDDSTNQLRTKLGTDHGNTALNQGFLVHPRLNGQGTPRGEGFELRSDLSGAIRSAQGLLISTDPRIKSTGRQLDRQELIGQLEAALAIAKQLAELSDTHHADSTDTQPQDTLLGHLKQWEAGSNTDKDGNKTNGGKPIIAVSAAAGIAISTTQSMTLNTGTNLDLVTTQDANLTMGQKLKIRAAEAISLFAHKLGIKLIAAAGKIDIQAHNGNIEITASETLILTGIKGVIINGQMFQVNTQGAGLDMGNGAITSKTTGAHTAHAAQHTVSGPAAANFTPPGMPTRQANYDEKYVLRLPSGDPMKQVNAKIKSANGKTLWQGKTGAQGETGLLLKDVLQGIQIEFLPD